jgi:KTSC domain
MQHEFKSGWIRGVTYDAQEKQLDIEFENKSVLAYKGVPLWIFEKICRDPSPKAFWEDQIKEEYTPTTPQKKASSEKSLDALKNLFGNS